MRVACSVLEVGCGSGYVSCSTALLLQHYGVTGHILAVDINLKAVTATQETLKAHQVRC